MSEPTSRAMYLCWCCVAPVNIGEKCGPCNAQGCPSHHRRDGDESLHPGCHRCHEMALGEDHDAPRHDPSPRCESGGHPHCACPICFG